MDLGLKAKRVFISGSTAGIGFGIAQVFLNEGADVCINGRSEESVEKAKAQLLEQFPNGKVSVYTCDYRNEEEIDQLLNELPDIDILINNVGTYTSKSFYNTSDQDWHDQFNVNVMSGVRMARKVLPAMLERNWGRILFISSECASLVPSDLIAYSATKAAIQAVSRGLAQLTKGSQVTVNTVLPGSTMTEGAAKFLADLADKENKTVEEAERDFFKDIRTSSLMQRFATVEEIANSVVYYASPLAAATNGAAIKLEGGSTGGIF
ncbi:MAG: SDR family NAD(P)-dependent oxidoreductase [Bacteroidota bacterium]